MRNSNANDFVTVVLQASQARPVVVDFWASRCQPCHVLSPILEALEDEADGAWELVKIDVDANPQLADDYQVRGVPAVKAFVDGEVVDAFVGAWPRENIRRWLADIVLSDVDLTFREARERESTGDLQAAADGYERVLARVPERDDARLGLARVAVAMNDIEGAQAHLSSIPQQRWPELGGDAESVWVRIEVAGFGAASDDLESKYQEALRDAVGGNVQGALESLLKLVDKHPDWRDGQAGRAMVKVIATMGRDPRVSTWRSRLGRLLYR